MARDPKTNSSKPTKPNCKLCNDTGKIFVCASEKGMKFASCGCKQRYSYGDTTHTKEENKRMLLNSIFKFTKQSISTNPTKFVDGICNNCEGSGYVYIRDTTKTCPECNGKGEIPKSERQIFYDNISSFISYPNVSLSELAKKFEDNSESLDDLKRLKGLLHMDNFALYIAKRDGIHPNSGVKWKHIGEERYEYLVKRNLNMMSYLESVIKTLETKYKSTYENPNHKLFVG